MAKNAKKKRIFIFFPFLKQESRCKKKCGYNALKQKKKPFIKLLTSRRGKVFFLFAKKCFNKMVILMVLPKCF